MFDSLSGFGDEDAEDVWDDTPEGERRPQRARRPRPGQEERKSQAYKELRKQYLFGCSRERQLDGTYGRRCALESSTPGCPGKINYATHHRSPWAPTVDHIVPFRIRPDLVLDVTNWQPAHRHCNEARERSFDNELAGRGEPSEEW